ncbi:Bifunctional NAD(P)H-hydrate repair enzyme Nnr [Pseudoruegeria aquimaris]|uniref:Bifunctional NAD(P)H-hydrate repair enzyme n=2 Tax=Pseudoruegeria aquimaris TaxID=393663 RepID=A0A1Y5SHL2_9RHOB|nr:Bifunctional NAD(P)H-hydrate repair enzyme Nnr [Pseudoruegeria aquimaris]
MRAAESAAIAAGEATGLELMERAGEGVVAAIEAEWPDLAGEGGSAPRPADSPRGISGERKRAAVLCGPGNNGGDGFVVARLLRQRGWAVEVFLFGAPERLPPDARVNHDRWCGMSEVRPWPGPEAGFDPWGYALIVDALFGTGLTRGLSFEAGFGRMLPEWDLRGEPARPRIVAVDLPSGLCSDSGRMLAGDGLWADLTVSFHRFKRGHFLAEGPFHCGSLRLVDIGLPEGGVPDAAALVSAPAWRLGKGDPFGQSGHKYSHGHVLVCAGGRGRTGAARLAARAALRVGAGLVSVAAPPEAVAECAAQLTAIMLNGVEDGGALARLLEDARLNVLCLGPGLGQARARAYVDTVLGPAVRARATVLDADALSAFAEAPEALLGRLHPLCVLTPHGGEFARLFPDLAERLAGTPDAGPAFSKLDAVQAAAARAGCTVLLKGADTAIAAPDGRCALHGAAYERAAPWLATAGAGDVLAGLIAGLMARGAPAFEAAQTAAYLHVEAARAFGPGLIAEDLPEAIPEVLRRLEA